MLDVLGYIFYIGRNKQVNMKGELQMKYHKSTKQRNITIIGEGTTLRGDIVGGNINISGKLYGDIDTTESVVIARSAEIKGDINASSISIAGEVTGDVDTDRLELKKGCLLVGNATTNDLVVDSNAVFNGQCNMYKDMIKEEVKRK